MNEKQAWQCFQETGSVEAYLQYARLVHARGAATGKVVDSMVSYSVAPQEVSDADRDGRAGNPGKKRGGKR